MGMILKFKSLKILLAAGFVVGYIEYRVGKVHKNVGVTCVSLDEGRQVNTVRPIEEVKPENVGFDDYGMYKHFSINKERDVSVLITGARSYIGESFEQHVREFYPNIHISTLDLRTNDCKKYSFTDSHGQSYDTVFHVAGIAHSDAFSPSKELQKEYYRVNTELALECCEHAKAAGVKQFIFMSSMIVYGSQECIDEYTLPAPSNFYGNSKWLSDVGVRRLGSSEFKVAVLRTPMIYGKGSKGNYPQLAKIARHIPVFPSIDNQRSMLYIGNLCEFVAQLVLSGSGGIYFPQNQEFANTSTLVQMIGKVKGKKVFLSRALNMAVGVAEVVPGRKVRGLVSKAFGSSFYEQRLSKYDGLDYCKYSLEESVELTEG